MQACVSAGCHYTDTNGEQGWMIRCDEEYGEKSAGIDRLLAPGIAQMYTTGEIAANIALQTPGLDTLDVLVSCKGYPTVAWTETILVNAAQATAFCLEGNQDVESDAEAGTRTGLLQAYAAHHLTIGKAAVVGMGPACQAVGHRTLPGVLKHFGLVSAPQVTGHFD